MCVVVFAAGKLAPRRSSEKDRAYEEENRNRGSEEGYDVENHRPLSFLLYRQGQHDDLEPYSHPTWSKRPSKVACRAGLELPVSAMLRPTGRVSTGCSALHALGRREPDPTHRHRTLFCGKLLAAIHVHRCMTVVSQCRKAEAGGRDALANLSFREIHKFATIHVSSGAVQRIPVHRKRSPFDV